jgi:hypothetical protein
MESVQLVFDDGALSVYDLSIDSPDVAPADSLEWPPTKFVYTGNVSVSFGVSQGSIERARAVFHRGGGACKIAAGDDAVYASVQFAPTNWTESASVFAKEIYGQMSGLLRGIVNPGEPVPGEYNDFYALIHNVVESTPEEDAAADYDPYDYDQTMDWLLDSDEE